MAFSRHIRLAAGQKWPKYSSEWPICRSTRRSRATKMKVVAIPHISRSFLMKDSTITQARNAKVMVDDPWKLRYWMDKFGVTEEQLKNAVAEVGPVANKVQKH